MAQFTGFTCDSCGNVVSADARTKMTVKFVGGPLEGQYDKDLCTDCVDIPEGVELRPLRRRTPREESEAQQEREQAASGPDDRDGEGVSSDDEGRATRLV